MTAPGNPYVGPRAFRRGEQLYGRDEEARAVTNLVLSERVALLYSPSGAGKSSLVEASVATKLSDDDLHVFPTLRVCDHPHEDMPPGANPFLLSVLLTLEDQARESPRSPAVLPSTSLKDYLTSLETELSGGDPARFFDVMILDQFEEILLLGVPDEQTARWRREFFEELGEALKSPRRFALFCMREDFIAGLDPYARFIPTRLTNTFRLELLTRAKAAKAIAEPARAAGVTFDADALEHLVTDLSRITVQGPRGSVEHEGLFVEPVQLQIVCRRLWEKLRETGALEDLRIEEREVVEVVSEVDEALASYYEEHVREAARVSGVDERCIRDWIAHELIGASGIRNQVQQGPHSTTGDPTEALRSLQGAFLIRTERRYGADWYELAHDRLLRPVQRNNSRWSQAHLRPLQLRSQHWARDRDHRLLLRGAELEAEAEWAKRNSSRLTEDDRRLLEESVREADEAKRRRLRDAVVVAALAAAALLLTFQWHRERVRIADQTLAGASEWAELVARVVDDKLHFATRFIEVEARQDALRALLSLQGPDVGPQLQEYMADLFQRAEHFDFFQTVLVTDRSALVLAAAPESRMDRVIGRAYPYREWFNGERDFLDAKGAPRPPRRRAGLTLAYKSTQEGSPMLVALATPVVPGDEDHGGEPLGVLQGTINVDTFNRWLSDVEKTDGECPVLFSLLLNREQLIRHPCPGDATLPLDGYGNRDGVSWVLVNGTEVDFRDPIGNGRPYFAAATGFGEDRRWKALVLHDKAQALPMLWLTIIPVVLLAGVTVWVAFLLFRRPV